MTKPPRPKYQVFISSTFTDLHHEREAVTWGVLSTDNIPVGMENFTATDDRGWQSIKALIDNSDYYVLLLAGRYGSLSDDGRSWTHREYDYAVSLGIPVLAFIRDKNTITADKMEDDSKLKDSLVAFIKSIKASHLTVTWASEDKLVGQVMNALNKKIKTDEDSGEPRPGWYRGNSLPFGDGSARILELTGQLTKLTDENSRLKLEVKTLEAEAKALEAKALEAETSKAQALIKQPTTVPALNAESNPRVLLLVDLDERPLPDNISNDATFYSSNLSFKNEDAYLLGALHLIQIGVRNRGEINALNINVDLDFSDLAAFSCGSFSGGDLPQAGAQKAGSGLISSVRRLSWKRLRIQMKLVTVIPGEVVYLPDIFAIGTPKKDQSGTSFLMEYAISSGTHQSNSGHTIFETAFTNKAEIRSTDLKDRIQKLAARGLPIGQDRLGDPTLTNLELPGPPTI